MVGKLLTDLYLADSILVVHVLIILFNIFGLVAIPLGAWYGWRWVRILWWRSLHLLFLFVVAIQAVMGRACFLTIWQSQLQEQAGREGFRAPLIQTWVNHFFFWNLPMAFFTTLYVLVWIYVVILWWKVPPYWRKNTSAR
ncbi:DUF2784 domain-containing protein [Acidithiobacillus sp. AMEEHan]|uniref:DUF2784 domain-containing protein n=1 Tax=Acidithiobacillus sp. AMEEHan TaxID=2994951 RepID=UPI0027E4DCA9|nr:DUF2784 domain-containing protein [Acidithiobacillus sp. AMEEHan]